MNNFDLLIKTINTLAPHYGYYATLKWELNSMSKDTRKAYKNCINNLPLWQDSIDVIRFLEL